MQITIQDFSGVYSRQTFMQALRHKAMEQVNIVESSPNGEAAENPSKFLDEDFQSLQVHWIDCTQISGTDCYCDSEAEAALKKEIEKCASRAAFQQASLCAFLQASRAAFQPEQKPASPTAPHIHFFDNGNYHYMSKIWTDMVRQPFTLVVFDHHPDMQPPRFGGILSCGGWVKEVLETNKFIQKTYIIGASDSLVEEVKADQECAPILGKVSFVKESELSKLDEFNLQDETVYLSIDKDALSPAIAATNWDQGSMTLAQLENSILKIAENNRIVAVDICGEVALDQNPSALISREHTCSCFCENSTSPDELNGKLNRELLAFLIKTLGQE